jgi:hypothetical protein
VKFRRRPEARTVGLLLQAEFKLVEIEPLLGYQFIVEADRSKFHCAGLKNPSVADL